MYPKNQFLFVEIKNSLSLPPNQFQKLLFFMPLFLKNILLFLTGKQPIGLIFERERERERETSDTYRRYINNMYRGCFCIYQNRK